METKERLEQIIDGLRRGECDSEDVPFLVTLLDRAGVIVEDCAEELESDSDPVRHTRERLEEAREFLREIGRGG